jgi:hypothetical protein
MHQIIALVSDKLDKKLEICHSKLGFLEVREQLSDAGDILSPETKALWMTRKDAGFKAKSNDEDEIPWAGGEDSDYTACTDTCGYCGHCTY